MARKEQLLAALVYKKREEKKLKKLQEDIHAQNTILFDMQVQVKEVIFNSSRFFVCSLSLVPHLYMQRKMHKSMKMQYQWNPSETSSG